MARPSFDNLLAAEKDFKSLMQDVGEYGAFKAEKDLLISDAVAQDIKLRAQEFGTWSKEDMAKAALQKASGDEQKALEYLKKARYNQKRLVHLNARFGEKREAAIQEAAKKSPPPEGVMATPQQVETMLQEPPGEYRLTEAQAVAKVREEGLMETSPEGIARLKELRGETHVGPPPKSEPGILGQVLTHIARPSRAMTGFAGGIVKGVREEVSAPESLPELQGGRAGAYPEWLGRDVGDIGRALWEKPQKLAAIAWEAGKGAIGAFKADDPVSQHDFSYQLQKAAQEIEVRVWKDVASKRGLKSLRDLGDYSKEEIAEFKKEVDERYDLLLQQQMGETGLRHPRATEFAGQVVADPLMFVTPAKIGSTAAVGIKKLPQGAKLLQHTEMLLKSVPRALGMKYMGHLNELEAYGGKWGRDLASRLRLAHTRSQKIPKEFKEALDKAIPKMEAVKTEHQALLWQVADNQIPLENALPLIDNPKDVKKFLEAVYANDELAKVHAEIGATTGMLKRWAPVKENVTVLMRAEKSMKAGRYAPRALPKKEFQREAADIFATKSESLRPGAAVARKAPTSAAEKARIADIWEPNVAKQWKEEAKYISPRGFVRKGKKAGELREIYRTLDDASGVLTFSAKKAGNVRNTLGQLKEVTGVDWVDVQKFLGEDAKNEWLRITGKPGQKASDIVLMPKSVATRAGDLITVIGKYADDASFQKKFWAGARDFAVRPFNKYFSLLATTPNPMFAARNGLSAVGLGYVAHGAKIASPNYQKNLAALALDSAGIVPESMRGMKIKVAGKDVPLRELTKIAAEDGVTGMMRQRFGFERTGRGVLGAGTEALERGLSFEIPPMLAKQFPAVAKSLKKLGKGVSPQAASSITEDYQHLVTWLGYVQKNGLSDVARARATDFMSEFSGNYARMGKFEKAFLKEVFPFYAWQRFIVPYGLKRLIDSPKRMADFAKLHMAAEKEYGYQVPTVSGRAIPERMRGLGVTAPSGAQFITTRDLKKKYMKDGKLPKIDSHEAAMMMMETPLTMSLYALPMIENLFKNRAHWQDEDVNKTLGPIAMVMVDMLAREGRPVQETLAEATQRFGVPRPVTALAGRSPVKALKGEAPWEGIIGLMKNTGQMEAALEWKMRLQAFRYLGPLYYALEDQLDPERALGPMPPPGATSVYPIDPERTAAGEKKTAVREIKSRTSEILPWE